MGGVFTAAISRIGDSKTYVLLILFALLALITCIVAAAIFGENLWDRFFDLLIGESATAGVRAVAVDGAPKVAAAWRDPASPAANPPSAMMALVPPPGAPNTYVPPIPAGGPPA